MSMTLSECNLSSISAGHLESCLSDCQQRFPLRFFITLSPLLALSGNSDNAQIIANVTCNNWRWQSAAFTAVAIGAAAVGLATLLLSAKREQAKPFPPTVVVVKPPANTIYREQKTSMFTLFRK
jgi:hypothetical protein